MIEVVLDTNVWLLPFVRASGLRTGCSRHLKRNVGGRSSHRRWRSRYEAVLKRGVPEVGLTLQDIDDFIEYLCGRAKLVQIYFRWRPALPDPDDDRILEVAVRARAAVVTFNTRDFVGAEQFGVRLIGPKEMLTLIGGHP